MVNWNAVKKWRDALRSGKYKQTKNYLKTTEGHCCLGVLCEIQGLKGKKLKNQTGYEFNGCSGTLPVKVAKKIGFVNIDGDAVIDPKIFNEHFSYINDKQTDPLNFDEIADLLDIAILEREGIT